MATAVAHDVGAFCAAQGSTTYNCSLNAQGAFDSLPHSIILNKVMDIIPGPLWLLLFPSYSNMFVEVKWQDHISEPVQVKHETKQGSLTSPFCFNIFYQDLIEKRLQLWCKTK